MAADCDVSERDSENECIDHYHNCQYQDRVEGNSVGTDDEEDDNKNENNIDAAGESDDGNDLGEMTENNMKSESDENGSGMHTGTPTKVKLDPKDPTRHKRKKARRACFACQRAHLTCGDERPCQRCIKRGLADACQDGIRKKAKYLHDAPPDALRPVLGPYYKPNYNKTTNHGRSVSGNDKSMNRESSNTSPTITNNTRMSSIFSLQGTPSYPMYNQSNFISPPLQTRLSMNNQKLLTSPPFNYQATSIQGIPLPPQVSPNDPQRGSFNTGAMLFDPSNPALYGLDLESLNFGNHYGALEFGILGHMSSGVDEVTLKDQSAFVSTQELSEVNFNDNNIYGNGLSNCNQMFQNDLINYGSVPEDQIFPAPQDLPHAYAIATGSQGQYSPSTEASSSVTSAYENSPVTTSFTPNSTAYMPTPKSLKPIKARLAGTSSGRSGFGSNLLRKRSRDSSSIYDIVQEPYPYTAGFHNLTAFLQRRFSSTETFRIAKSLASIRPSFISCMKTLNRQDLIFMEKCFQRTLFEYEAFMHNCCTPTIVCRRTGEITAVNQEFTIMTGWRKDVLLGKEPNFNINTGKPCPAVEGENGSETGRTTANFHTSRIMQQSGGALKYNSNSINDNNGNEKLGKDFVGLQQPILLAEVMDAEDVVEFYQDFARLAFNDSRGSIMSRCKLLKYGAATMATSTTSTSTAVENDKGQCSGEISANELRSRPTINCEKMATTTKINGNRKIDSLTPGGTATTGNSSNGQGNNNHGLRELHCSSSNSNSKRLLPCGGGSSNGGFGLLGNFERDGKIDCCYCWTVKRDVFDIPMMIILNFLPCI